MSNQKAFALVMMFTVSAMSAAPALADKKHHHGYAKSEICPNEFESYLKADSINFELLVEIEPITPGFAILEGPLWLGDGLLMSHIGYPTSAAANNSDLVVLRGGEIHVLQAGYGSNGLALDNQGHVLAARHMDGTITRIINGSVLAEQFYGIRFNSPNDLIMSHKGHLYFSDPNWQTPDMNPETEEREMPQAEERAYHVTPDGEISEFAGDLIDKPNGVMLSHNENALYVGGTNGLFKYPLSKKGEVINKPTQITSVGEGIDGMSKDCAGNIYVAGGGQVHVISKKDELLASFDVPGATNVAFGGDDGKTIYVTTLSSRPSVYTAQSNIPGYPY